MVNYSNTKIYKIMSHLGEKIYIGSTTKQYLSQRMDNHRTSYKRWKAGIGSLTKSYEIFDEYGIENCEIILIESYPCNSKDESLKKESEYIRQLECVNKIIPQRTVKEYRQDNKEHISMMTKEYKEKNKDAISAKKKEYNEKNKDSLSAKKKEYKEKNKFIISAQRKEYYEKNKDAMYAKKKEYRARKKAELNLI